MIFRKVFVDFLSIVLAMLLTGPALAQFKDLCSFKDVAIPCDLKHGDTTLEKGKYDLEALKNPSTPMCYLRIKKGGKILCLIDGERLDYEVHGMDRMRDPSIPDKATLKMRKNPAEKTFTFLVETGRQTANFPFLKLRFKLEYEE